MERIDSCVLSTTFVAVAVQTARHVLQTLQNDHVEICRHGRRYRCVGGRVERLHALGFRDENLRCLVCRGYAQYLVEALHPKSGKPVQCLVRQPTSFRTGWLILTPAGLEFARQVEQFVAHGGPSRPRRDVAAVRHGRPHFDGRTRVLTLDGRALLQLSARATAQIAVLESFQSLAWAEGMKNPFDCDGDSDAVRKLQNATYLLNCRQPLIRFSIQDGGRGVRWTMARSDVTPVLQSL